MAGQESDAKEFHNRPANRLAHQARPAPCLPSDSHKLATNEKRQTWVQIGAVPEGAFSLRIPGTANAGALSPARGRPRHTSSACDSLMYALTRRRESASKAIHLNRSSTCKIQFR